MNLKDEGVVGVEFLCLCDHYCTNRMKKKSGVPIPIIITCHD